MIANTNTILASCVVFVMFVENNKGLNSVYPVIVDWLKKQRYPQIARYCTDSAIAFIF